MTVLQVTSRDGGVRFGVHVKPRSAKSELKGVRDGALEIALRAPPVDGEANDELVRLLARVLGLGKSAVRIARGAQGRRKLVDVDGLDRDELVRRLELG